MNFVSRNYFCLESTVINPRYLRANNITKLVLSGVSTGGVILTTVREAFDLDFELTVLSDGCADRIQEQGDALIKHVLPNQCTVCTVEEWGAAL